MPLTADRCQETSTTTGTGALTLLGATAQYQSFATAFPLNARFMYAIVGQTGTDYEIGQGYLTSSSVLVRESVRTSSNANTFVNFSGTLNVFATLTANQARSANDGLVLAMSRGWGMP
jgi:hypothetical protein